MLRQTAANDDLHSKLFVPRTARHSDRVSFEQRYPYNASYVNFDADVLAVVSQQYHKYVSYTDYNGHPNALNYFAQLFGVSSTDVCLAPTSDQAHWYLTALFLNDGDTVAANEGLHAELKKVKLDSQYKIGGLSSIAEAKLVMIRNPDVDSDTNEKIIESFTQKLTSTESDFVSPKAVVLEEPFVLLGKQNQIASVCRSELPEKSPVYLVTHLSELFLCDSSSFSVIVLLNNKNNRFEYLNTALRNLACFYFPPTTAVHSHISDIMQVFKVDRALENYGKLEERKKQLISRLSQQGIELRETPKWVFSVGVRKTQQLAALLEKGLLGLATDEVLREADFVYFSVLHSDAHFDRLVEMLKAPL